MPSSLIAQQAIQTKLHLALAETQHRNPSYSLRAFALRLGISPSALSEVLNGKRKVSRKLALRLLMNLGAKAEETEELLKLFTPVQLNQDPTALAKEIAYHQLTADQFLVIAEWYHFAILSLAETHEFKSTPVWIAKRLNISQGQAESALERLLSLGRLKRNAKGNLMLTDRNVSTPDEISMLALVKAHRRNLELAAASLGRDSISERDFTSTTMAINIKKIPVAKRMIREFQDQLSKVMESGARTEVYKICVQLFPLSTREGGAYDH